MNKDQWLTLVTLFKNVVICGADYEGVLNDSHFWICPVTLFVLGRYPKYIYIKEI